MFADTLTTEERDSLVVLLAFMAATDGEVRPVEREFVRHLTHQLDIDGDPFDRLGKVSLFDLCEAFTSPRSRRIALIELLKAAHVDGEYHSSEEKGIKVIAELMDIGEATVDALVGWVEAGFELKAAGEQLVEYGPSDPDEDVTDVADLSAVTQPLRR